MKKRLILWQTILVFSLILTACAPASLTAQPSPQATSPAATSVPTSAPTSASGDLQPAIIAAIKKFAGLKYSAKPEDVAILSAEAVDWPDGCLGAGQPGEICTQSIVPGFRVRVEISDRAYELHTDNGQNVRLYNPPSAGNVSGPAAETARLYMMDLLKVDSSAIQITSVNDENWPDGCLGIHRPDQKCTDAIVPGSRVILNALGTTYEMRTSRDGQTVLLVDPLYQVVDPALTMLDKPQVTWKGGIVCSVLQVMGDQVAFGPCGGKLKITGLANPDRGRELVTLLASYRPFTSPTPAGQVSFYGGGGAEATPAQQRSLAEWAQMVYQETNSSSALPDQGLALTWKRVGGIAGFCDILKVYRSGLAMTSSCRSGAEKPLSTHWLDTAQLNQLYQWLDGFQVGSGKQGDQATADAMTITWALSATGTRTISAGDQQNILNFAAQVFSSK